MNVSDRDDVISKIFVKIARAIAVVACMYHKSRGSSKRLHRQLEFGIILYILYLERVSKSGRIAIQEENKRREESVATYITVNSFIGCRERTSDILVCLFL